MTVGRAVVAFGRFWWDFLVGDTPEVTVGALAVIGLAALLSGLGVAAVILLPAAVVCVLTLSVGRAVRRSSRLGPARKAGP